MNRCTGHCCRSIVIPYSPEELADASIKPEIMEAAAISNMLVLVEKCRGSKTNYRYTCRHFVDNECAIYPNRPTMCMDYPYGMPCTVDGCTWDAAREGTVAKPTHLPLWQPHHDTDAELPSHHRPDPHIESLVVVGGNPLGA